MAVFELNNLYSHVLSRTNEVTVFLPDRADKPYNTLWCFHGGNGDWCEWVNNTSIFRYAENNRTAVVITSTNNSMGMDMAEGAAYGTYILDELVPQVRGIFPSLSRERRRNFVAGISMGGFCSFKLAVNRPDLFCKAGAFAGAIMIPVIFDLYTQGKQPGGPDFDFSFGSLDRLVHNENDILWKVGENIKAGLENPKLYMVCGKDDFGYELNTQARDGLRANGADVTWNTVEGVHSYDCWDPYIPGFFDWLYEKNNCAH